MYGFIYIIAFFPFNLLKAQREEWLIFWIWGFFKSTKKVDFVLLSSKEIKNNINKNNQLEVWHHEQQYLTW